MLFFLSFLLLTFLLLLGPQLIDQIKLFQIVLRQGHTILIKVLVVFLIFLGDVYHLSNAVVLFFQLFGTLAVVSSFFLLFFDAVLIHVPTLDVLFLFQLSAERKLLQPLFVFHEFVVH
jgi:hypothetical protein